MNQDKVKTFLVHLAKEIEITNNSTTNASFIERISERLLPILQNNELSYQIIKKWESEILQFVKEMNKVAEKACNELTTAFKELWHELIIKGMKKGVIHTINGVRADKFLIGILQEVCRGSVCAYVKRPIEIGHERLKNLYCNCVSKSWDSGFAPNAEKYLELTSDRETSAKIESISYLIWNQFLRLSKAWKLRNERLRVGFGRVRGAKKSMLFRAHNADLEARFNYFAEDLKNCDSAYGLPQIFQRQYFSKILDSLYFELEIAFYQMGNKKLSFPVSEGDHRSKRKYLEDMNVLVPFCESEIQRFEVKGLKFNTKVLIDKIIISLEENQINLNRINRTRIREAIRQARANAKGVKRIIKSREKTTPKTDSQKSNQTPKKKKQEKSVS